MSIVEVVENENLIAVVDLSVVQTIVKSTSRFTQGRGPFAVTYAEPSLTLGLNKGNENTVIVFDKRENRDESFNNLYQQWIDYKEE